jgi:hypothetical protein
MEEILEFKFDQKLPEKPILGVFLNGGQWNRHSQIEVLLSTRNITTKSYFLVV